jgi:DNA-binding transcriptional LysR family regulator
MINMASLRQLNSLIAVYEEGSFTAASERENATQSGISQHISAIEKELGINLFTRNSNGVIPTTICHGFYKKSVEAIRTLKTAEQEAINAGKGLSGKVNAGLMPTFTRAALAPVLKSISATHPNIEISIVESYSGSLTDMVKAGELDFALVPVMTGTQGIKYSNLVRDREVLVSSPSFGTNQGEEISLKNLAPLKIVLPTKANIRRIKLEDYFTAHSIEIANIMEMDSMIGTLELVGSTDWVTILPYLICVPDTHSNLRHINPICEPNIYSDFVIIEPIGRSLTPQATFFLKLLKEEISSIAWQEIQPNRYMN